MTDSLDPLLQDALADAGLAPELLEGLASQLVWRVGRVGEDGPVTIRVGFASSAPLFADLPRLRNATDGELEEALRDRDVRVEWVGLQPS